MTAEEPRVSPAGRYSIPETCRILGIHRNTLFRYTMSGKIKCGFRRANGKKFYWGADILRFWRGTL